MGEDQALGRLHDILARSDFQTDLHRPFWEPLLKSWWDVLGYLVARLVQLVLNAANGREGFYGWTVLALCGLLIASVGVYVLHAVRLNVTSEIRLAQLSLQERRERSQRLWTTAQRLAAGGQLAEAVRVVYLSALYALDERALLRVEAGLTNREHARELGRLHPDVAAAFADVVDSYDRVRYGNAGVSEATFAEISGLVARSRAAALGQASG